MKKIIRMVFVIVLCVSFKIGQAQKEEGIIAKKVLNDSLQTVGWHYTLKTKNGYLWGCNSMVIPYHAQDSLAQEISLDGFTLTMIELKTKLEKDIVIFALHKYIVKQKFTPRDAFEKIFNFYFKNKVHDKYWAIKLMDEK